jgi:hypothetical protein
MTFQRIIAGLLALTIAGLAGALYLNWKTTTQLRTLKAFVESYVFAEAVAACEKATSSTPFNWNAATNASVIGLHGVKLDRKTIIASYTLFADGVFCDYDPVKKKSGYRIEFPRAGLGREESGRKRLASPSSRLRGEVGRAPVFLFHGIFTNCA